MNLVQIAHGRKSGWGGGTYGPSGGYSLGTPYATIDRKDRAPSPLELVSQLVGTAYSCANLNANAVAANPLRLFVRTAKGQRRTRWATEPVGRKMLRWLRDTKKVGEGFVKDGGTVEEVKSHPLLDVLDIGDGSGAVAEVEDDEGQPRLLGHHLFWATQIYLETIARAYWLIERDGLGTATKIWLLRSHLVREWPAEGDEQKSGKIIKYYEYGGGAGAHYDPKDIIRFSNPDPHLLYIGGLSPMRAAIEKIRLQRRDDAMLNAVLENMGYPGVILSPKPVDGGGAMLSPDTARRVRVAWDQMLRQAGAGGTITLPEAFDVHFPQMKPAEIITEEKLAAIKCGVCNCFTVPDALLDLNSANLASAKTAGAVHKEYAIKPRCSNIETTLRRLTRMFDDSGRMFLAYDNPVPDDEIFALEQMKAASASGAITRNEIRHSVELAPMPWGDTPLIPNTMVAADPETGRPEASAAPKPPVEGQTANPAKPPKKNFSEKSGAGDDDGHWVTINGVHVLIGDDGTITRGPRAMIGKKPEELGTPKRDASSARAKSEKMSPQTKSAIAQQSARYTGAKEQQHAEDNEKQFAKKIGGLSYDDSEPVDIVAGSGGVVEHGIEMKTLLSNTNDKLTMDTYSQVRKINWEKNNSATYHTVVVDDRGDSRTYYYRRGVAGSARIGNMQKVRSVREVQTLMQADESKLPAAAQRTDGKLREGTWKQFSDNQGLGFKNSKTGRIVRPKK